MKKILFSLMLVMMIFLSACGSDKVVYNFKIRKDSYYIDQADNVIIEYKTNEDGKLVEIGIDRLLAVEDIIYYNSEIDYDMVVEGFTGDIFTEASFLCTGHDDLLVPINIEVGNVRFKYDYTECDYIEVDRDNDAKVGTYVRKYDLRDTIDVSRDTLISIVVFDADSIERFLEVQYLPHTMKMLGIYGIGFNLDRDDFSDGVVNYYRDITIYEQLLLKTQDNADAVSSVLGESDDINLLELDDIGESTTLVASFGEKYEIEITAVDELIEEISVIEVEETGSEAEETE